MNARPESASRASLALLAMAWCGAVAAAQLTPAEAARNPSMVTPNTPAGAPAARATEQPTIRIVEPPNGATRTPGKLRVRIVASHVDLSARAIVSLTWAMGYGNAWGLPSSPSQITQAVPLQRLVAGWVPPRDFIARAPEGVPISLEVFGDAASVHDNTQSAFEDPYERSVAGMRAQATIRLVDTDPGEATQGGSAVTSAMPSPAAISASGRASGVQAPAPQATTSATPPSSAAIRATGQSGARIRIVEPAAGSTTTPATTRLRVDYPLHPAGQIADIELAWQDYTSKTGPMQASLLTGQGSKTWQVSFGQLAAGFVVPADKICTCTNGRATFKVRPAGTQAWQDEVAFNVVAGTASGTMSSPKAWPQAIPPAATGADAARSTLLTTPAARATLPSQAPASSFQRP
jgi:hypothetical protein